MKKTAKRSGKARIRHIYHLKRRSEAPDQEIAPRGWIDPDGKFRASKAHWAEIRSFLGKSRRRKKVTDDAEEGERLAQQAYSLGWISLSHGGVLNAVGHKNTFVSKRSAAAATLRKLLTRAPQATIRIETQIGAIDPETGRHEDFEVQEYDLGIFVRRGALRKPGW